MYNAIWRQNPALLDVIGVVLGGADMWIVTVTALFFLHRMAQGNMFRLNKKPSSGK